jgi:hypothetical protein
LLLLLLSVLQVLLLLLLPLQLPMRALVHPASMSASCAVA